MSSTGSGRPRLTRKGAATRARIVDAAAQLIYQQGVAHTTIEEVRDGAHVSSSQLYHYFDDKPVPGWWAQSSARSTWRLGLRSCLTWGAWTPYGSGAISWSITTGRRAGAAVVRCGSLGSELAETEPEARAVVAAAFNLAAEASIMAGLLRMHALGRNGPEADPRQLALALLAALEGGLLLAQIQRDPEPLAAALDAMLMLIVSLSSATVRSSAELSDRRPTGGCPGARRSRSTHPGLHEPVLLQSASARMDCVVQLLKGRRQWI